MASRLFLTAMLVCAIAQAAEIESPQQFAARLTPEQKQQFDAASQAFNSHDYKEALVAFKQLLQQLPSEPVLAKFATESALNENDPKFALNAVRPVIDVNPDDWQASALLARTYAQLGDAKARDAAMAQMFQLRQKGLTPPNMQAYALEHIKTGDNTLIIRASLVPWGPYNVYYLGQLVNPQGQIFMRMTLESGDIDQGIFAKEHPKEAAAGLRSFSIDGYAETGPNSNGQRTQQHFTFAYYTGEPTYDLVREKFLAIADRKLKPLSSRSDLTVQ